MKNSLFGSALFIKRIANQDIFHQYRFLEEKMADYPTFYEEYMKNEKARKLLLDYLSFN